MLLTASLPHELALAFLLGLGSSLHCLGMCGPLAMLLPMSHPGVRRGRALVIYNTGRLSSYALGGLLAASLGASLHWLGGDWLRGALVPLAALMVIITAATQAGWMNTPVWFPAAGRWLWRRLAPLSHLARAQGGYAAVYLMGLLWGWLPCGLVYAAFGLAAATGQPLQGVLLMLAFGAGTLPSMLGGAWIAAAWPGFTRHVVLRQGLAVSVIGLAVWSASLSLLPHDHAHHHRPLHAATPDSGTATGAAGHPHHH